MQVSLLAGETHDDVEHFESYGLTAHPAPGGELLVASLGGNRDHLLVMAANGRRFRIKSLAEGEVTLYDDLGQVVHLKRDGIQIESKSQVTIHAPTTTVDGDSLDVTGDQSVEGAVTVQGDVTGLEGSLPLSLSTIRDTFNTHTHTDPQGGVTGPPSVPL